MTTPIPSEYLTCLLAEAMGWEWSEPWGLNDSDRHPYNGYRNLFEPQYDHNAAQICVEECKKQGVIESYLHDLVGECGAWDEGDNWRFDLMVLATPEQKSRAALSALQLTKR